MFHQKASEKEPTTDQELLQEFLHSGDLGPLGLLYSRHAQMVFYVCMRYFKEKERAEDAVMEIFESLIHKVGKQEVLDFPRWLYVVTKNHCLMALRSDKTRAQIPRDSFVEFSVPQHPSSDAQQKEELLQQLEQCIAGLQQKQRACIALFFLEEKCYKEIVEHTGFSIKEVKSYIQNGKRNLKICLSATNSYEQ